MSGSVIVSAPEVFSAAAVSPSVTDFESELTVAASLVPVIVTVTVPRRRAVLARDRELVLHLLAGGQLVVRAVAGIGPVAVGVDREVAIGPVRRWSAPPHAPRPCPGR